MKTGTIVCCVFSLILGMLLSNILKDICDCKAIKGQPPPPLIHRSLREIQFANRMKDTGQSDGLLQETSIFKSDVNRGRFWSDGCSGPLC